MAYFAKVNNQNIVVSVVRVSNSVIEVNGVESETAGQRFLTNMYGNEVGFRWVQTSYNSTFRKNYAGKGDTYDAARDAFISPAPYSDWTLNETTCKWEPPVSYPDDGNFYTWDSATSSWTQQT